MRNTNRARNGFKRCALRWVSDIFPLAEQYLNQEDWQEIALAFRDNQDPLFGEVRLEHFRELFHQIVLLSPAPIGLAS